MHIGLLLPAEVFIKCELSNGSVSFGPGFFLAPGCVTLSVFLGVPRVNRRFHECGCLFGDNDGVVSEKQPDDYWAEDNEGRTARAASLKQNPRIEKDAEENELWRVEMTNPELGCGPSEEGERFLRVC